MNKGMTDWTDNLQETNKLIREVILPHMIQLQLEIASLRKHTWPYIQGQKEKNQLDDTRTKRDFMKHLDEETILELLHIKSRLTGNSGFVAREYDLITK